MGKHEANFFVENNELPRKEADMYENRFRCTLCKNILRKLAVSTFKEHYSTVHFHKEIEAKNKANLVRHIGSTHNKVVEILQLKGMEVPVVLVENNVNNKRKRSEIQPERSNKVKTVSGSNTFECPMCGSFYSSKSNLERHMVKIHN